MNKKIFLPLAVLLLVAGFIAGWLLPHKSSEKQGFVPVAKISGDVSKELLIGEVYPQFTQLPFTKDGTDFSGVLLSELIEQAIPYSPDSSLLIIADDGFTSELELPLPEDTYLCLTAQYGWELISLHHPQSANSKRIQEIVVVSPSPAENAIAVITSNANLTSITPGQLRKRALSLSPIKEGEATADYNGQQLNVQVYTTDRALPVSELAHEFAGEASSVMAVARNGKTLYDNGLGTIVYRGNTISYRESNGREQLHDISGIILDPPKKQVTQVYHDALEAVTKGEPVMVVYLDGLGYDSYRKSAELGAWQFLSSHSLLSSAVTAYTPVTNAGMAQMITGVTADRSGIHTREDRQPKVATIFGAVSDMGKTAVLVEGNIGILKTEVQPILNIDNNGNGTDDEVFATAMEQLAQNPDYIMVHFHGIDDSGHKLGPSAEATLDKMREVDGYLSELRKAFAGRIFVVSDHGMHTTTEGGGHGSFCSEDMLVPYFTLTNQQTDTE